MPTILEMTLGSMTQMWEGASGQTVSYYLTGLHLVCDELILDSHMDSALAERLAAGTPLNLPLTTHICFQQAISDNNGTPTIVVNRALSKLNEVWCTFAKDLSVTVNAKSPLVSEFYKGTNAGGSEMANGTTTMSLQIGSKRFPYSGPIATNQTFMYELEKAVGSIGSQYKNIGLSLENYTSPTAKSWINVFDLESSPPSADISFTGLNSRDASAITLSCKGLGVGTQIHQACHVILVAQIIISLSLDSCQVLE